ncbi:MAG: protein kinase, partial [Gemmatimonadetes bacterium]|nr:protein kinase [Gemmatimonadota bacterium]
MPDDLLRQAAVSFCVSEDLRFGELVGQGAFKQTFKVFGPDETTLALKVHRPGASPERTEREIEAMELCDHPNIGRLHQVSTIEVRAQSYVVTLEEFLGGGTLSDRVERSGLVTAVQLVALGAPLIDALQHIADHSLVHRDIKPENILFREDGVTPVIVDFGLVRALERSPLTRSWIIQGPGTP